MSRSRRGRGLTGLPLSVKLVLVAVLGVLWLQGPAEPDGAAAAEPSAPVAPIAAATQGGTPQEPLPESAAQAADEEHGPEAADFFLVLIAILITAKVLGELAERNQQPAVLGELVAGVILGGSVLGVVPLDGPMAEMIHLLAEVGVAILLFEIGLETDLKEMFRVGPSATAVAAVGVFTPFFLGFFYWFLLDPTPGARPEGVSLQNVAIFVGATLTATSVGITARVLTDLKVMHRAESRIIIGAAVIDDVLGLVILAVVASMAGVAGAAALSLLGIVWKLVVAVGFLVVAVILGNFVAPRLFGLIDRMSVRGVLLVSAFAFALLFGALAYKAGSAMIIGSFAAGIVLSSTNQFDLIVERIEPVADVFTPIFFVSVGAWVDVNLFNPFSEGFNADVIGVGVALIVVAVIGKVVSGFVVGWGQEKVNRLAIGIGMVPRGEVGLIFADMGLRNGIISQETFSAVLIMVIVTTFIAPPLLKRVFRPEGGPPAPASREPLHGGGVHA